LVDVKDNLPRATPNIFFPWTSECSNILWKTCRKKYIFQRSNPVFESSDVFDKCESFFFV